MKRDPPWRRRMLQSARAVHEGGHRSRLEEAGGIVARLLAPGHLVDRVGDAERAEEALSAVQAAADVLAGIEAMPKPSAYAADASDVLLRAVKQLDALIGAARAVWQRGLLYQAVFLLGEARGLSTTLQNASVGLGKLSGGGRPAVSQTGDQVEKQWRDLGATGREERDRAAVIASRLSISTTEVRRHIRERNLKTKPKANPR